MATATELKVGDRVEGGKKGTEDYDRGRVDIIHPDGQVTVSWDSLVVTTQPADLLRKIK